MLIVIAAGKKILISKKVLGFLSCDVISSNYLLCAAMRCWL